MSTNAVNDRAWVATRKGLFELSRHGVVWRIERVSFLGEPVTAVLPPDGKGRMLAALNLGHFGVKVHASADSGANWTEVAAPAYPPQPEAAPGPAWKTVMIWVLEQAHGTVWAGTLPGGLFRSADFGRSWQLVEALWQQPGRLEWFGGGYDVPGIHSICPHPQRQRELLVGVSCGGVWVTCDDGASWALQARGMSAAYMPPERAADENIQDAHRIARCDGSPDTLWCQHHNGVWSSGDNAASWQPITEVPVSAFGFAVAAHPRDPLTAWFAPAQADERRVPSNGAMAVNRTRDGGASFETLREGLPQRDCYDLVYRHGLAVADDGVNLLMGSTTGNLWSSSDSGELWHAVSLNLPPIHAVRYG
ncbi:exo-alpha-sialidase [Methylibium sp.]|uniref:WD40/YVTN/BNR-like repeat-containing protein n=1 Tax=Methylibium sp. TaxID=2067992 RepID=UPI0017EBAC2A|nr:exo-alpha-sialidase [Methylibium sp.]MBA3591371.1 exo-alpha-sialidase [Methylibium sp.]